MVSFAMVKKQFVNKHIFKTVHDDNNMVKVAITTNHIDNSEESYLSFCTVAVMILFFPIIMISIAIIIAMTKTLMIAILMIMYRESQKKVPTSENSQHQEYFMYLNDSNSC